MEKGGWRRKRKEAVKAVKERSGKEADLKNSQRRTQEMIPKELTH